MSTETFLSVIVTPQVALYSPLRRTETRQVSAFPSGQRRDLPRGEWFVRSPDSRFKKTRNVDWFWSVISRNHDNERLFRARSVPVSQGSQDSQRAQVVRGEQAALQGRRPGAVPASDHGPRAGAQRDRRKRLSTVIQSL